MSRSSFPTQYDAFFQRFGILFVDVYYVGVEATGGKTHEQRRNGLRPNGFSALTQQGDGVGLQTHIEGHYGTPNLCLYGLFQCFDHPFTDITDI